MAKRTLTRERLAASRFFMSLSSRFVLLLARPSSFSPQLRPRPSSRDGVDAAAASALPGGDGAACPKSLPAAARAAA